MTVVCGPSGSGKSSLAFETLFAEGQRRFIESMSNYAKQYLNKAPKPDLESVQNIPPAIAIGQKNTVKGSRSTVGTTTELVDYLRLLFEKVGVVHCPTHHVPTQKHSVTEATRQVMEKLAGVRGYILVKISARSKPADNKNLLAQFLQDGYLRIFLKSQGVGNLVELSDPLLRKQGLPKKEFYLVIDRLQFQESDRARLADSITQAYEASIKYNNSSFRECDVWTVSGEQLHFSEENSCPQCDFVAISPTSRMFSFNSPVGACPNCKGFGNILSLDEAKVVPNPKLSIKQGALNPFSMPSAAGERRELLNFCRKQGIDLDTPWQELPQPQRELLWSGGKGFLGVVGLFEYLEELKYKMHVRVFISRYRSPRTCTACGGSRLRKESLQVFLHQKNIADLCRIPIEALNHFFETTKFSRFEEEASGEVLKQIRSRLSFLMRVGVHYLTLDRETKTLSGGEFQRIMLAHQLGTGLSQTLYVLDEPTVGLHPRDNDRLISVLKDLRDLGNTLVIVEHDRDVIVNSENVLEIGPGSGSFGGQVVFSGPMETFLKSRESVTAPFIQSNLMDLKTHRPVQSELYKFKLELRGASGHNLKNLSVSFPLNRLVCVTGVSGSGKSTLVTKTLYPALAAALDVEHIPVQPFSKLTGDDLLKSVVLVDQSAVGKSARSSPVTYLKAFDSIRSLFASLTESKIRGYTPGTFSLNVDGGRCPACKGTGVEEIDMMFMDNVLLTCDVCDGKKYQKEILEITYKDLNVSQVLNLTVNEAMEFFVAYPHIRKPLSFLKEVGLEYIQLGQAASTLSGGETQRLKIAKQLADSQQKGTLYILDEPTTGLHFREVKLLMQVLHTLIENGASVILIEHNLDVIRNSDYVIDLGPEAGHEGGQIVAEGSPEEIMRVPASLTGRYLKQAFA